MELPCRIPYNPKWRLIIGGAVFFCVCSILMAYEATHNSRGLILDGIITLDPAKATGFFWVISSLGAAFVLLFVLLAARRILHPKVIEMGTDELLLPHGRFQSQTSRIDYSEIEGVTELEISGQTIFYLISKGRRYTIAASLFPNKQSYAAVRDFLIAQVPPPPTQR